MALGKTLIELADKSYDIRFVYGPMEPEHPLFSNVVTMIISKGEYYERIDLDVPMARQADDAYVDTLLESALEQGAKSIMEELLGGK